NDITKKNDDENQDFENFEDIKYAKIINELDDSMGANNVMFDAELTINHIDDVDFFLSKFKPKITRRSKFRN
ncbi:15958_t:CDS:1, partial [Cetraspora pellucida]